ncbi:MAG: outer membrane beta-barrel protein [candidate division Zixibacteria bacterium]
MKKSILTLTIVCVFALCSGADAVPSPFSFYAGGLFSMPSSPDGFKDTYNTGYHGFAGAGYSFMPNFQVVGKLEYNTFSYDWDNNAITGLSDGFSQNSWLFGADGRFSLGVPAAPMKPFFFAGLGMASTKWSEVSGTDVALATSTNTVLDALSSTNMYWNIGAGAEFKAGPTFSLFAQARYVKITSDGDGASYIPISLGLKFF